MAKKQNLEGYKRVGKRFIPPMKQLPAIREHSYINDMLPELIWLGLIHDRMGYQFGAKALKAVVEATKDLHIQKPSNFALQSAYGHLTDNQRASILELWNEWNLIDDIRYALAPLVLLYDGFCLSFVGPPSTALSQEALITRIRESVGNHLDKRQTPGVVLHGSMLLTRLMAGTIHIAAHIDIPDLNAVIDKPGSDEARKAASFMRANAGAEWGMLEVENSWAKYFWNRGAQLTPCERPDYASEDD